ncbi:hypothetical protein EV385_6514 [Krasilnikovia cinnamomea]|uniref:Uncharacterized protein n=1 Tax=Krasilnikovia cinnamomea TaxID=349313 RepID=A0A4Q7ZV84_9ACTN|nr:hypothetical protein [Krasilnikovia cinnamomea]RZU54563.1 hypothetical protein EV385_6514 [Krasilnikovia cinnamomea]
MDFATRIRAAQLRRAHRRIERNARRELETELAAVVTPAERTELAVTLNRHRPQEVWEIREILDRQDQARQHRASGPGGLRAA